MSEQSKEYPIGMNLGGSVARQYLLSFQSNESRIISGGNTIDVYSVEAEVNRYIKRNMVMSDGTTQILNEDNYPQKLFFTLRVDTQFDFLQALDFFNHIKLSKKALIIWFCSPDMCIEYADEDRFSQQWKEFGSDKDVKYKSKKILNKGTPNEETSYYEYPLRYKDLTPELVEKLKHEEGDIILRMFGNVFNGKNKNIDLFYTQEFFLDELNHKKRRRTISYMDTKIHLPTLESFLEVSPFELNVKEKRMLIDMLDNALSL